MGQETGAVCRARRRKSHCGSQGELKVFSHPVLNGVFAQEHRTAGRLPEAVQAAQRAMTAFNAAGVSVNKPVHSCVKAAYCAGDKAGVESAKLEQIKASAGVSLQQGTVLQAMAEPNPDPSPESNSTQP